jgi:hypothetical protein
MLERTVKRQLQDAGDAALASDDGPSSRPSPSWSTCSSAPVPSQNLMPDILMMQPAKDGNCRDGAHR